MSDNFKNGENQMKTPLSKAISVILIAGLTAILTACSSQSFQSTADSSYATAVQTTASPETTSVTAGTSAAPEATAETKPDTSYAETSTSAKTETTVTTTVSTTASTPALQLSRHGKKPGNPPKCTLIHRCTVAQEHISEHRLPTYIR